MKRCSSCGREKNEEEFNWRMVYRFRLCNGRKTSAKYCVLTVIQDQPVTISQAVEKHRPSDQTIRWI